MVNRVAPFFCVPAAGLLGIAPVGDRDFRASGRSPAFIMPLASCIGQDGGALGSSGVLIFPLVYVLVAQEQPLGSQALGKRFFEPRYLERFAAGGRGGMEGESPQVTLLDILQNFKAYEGRKIKTLGMVYRDDTVPPGHFLVFRFMIVCCAADAMPAGALVFSGEADSFEQDTWVSVEGVLGLKQVGDLIFPLIQADRITRIDPPKDPYLFPRLF